VSVGVGVLVGAVLVGTVGAFTVTLSVGEYPAVSTAPQFAE
jgi:hypothetical protein